jgi:hypothetical protein
MAWRVMMEKNDSTRFIQDEWVGGKCRWMRGFFASHFLTSVWCALAHRRRCEGPHRYGGRGPKRIPRKEAATAQV